MAAKLTADDIASVIIARSRPNLTAMSLQKLLYYVQAWHVAITDEPLFAERFKAWRDGPVVPQVWHARKAEGTRRPVGSQGPQAGLDGWASDLVDLVLRSYGSMSGDELSALTHVEGPWLDARGDLPPEAHSDAAISLDAMARFYRTHRRLDGQTAAELAVGGIPVGPRVIAGPVDVDAILRSLGSGVGEAGDDPWGGANLDLGDRYGSEMSRGAQPG